MQKTYFCSIRKIGVSGDLSWSRNEDFWSRNEDLSPVRIVEKLSLFVLMGYARLVAVS